MKTDTQLAHEMLATCEVCFLEGPAARLREHIATDHKEFFWPDLVRQYHVYDHADFPVTLPGRFWTRLARIETQTGRTFAQIVAGALDAQGLGRRARPRITQWSDLDTAREASEAKLGRSSHAFQSNRR